MALQTQLVASACPSAIEIEGIIDGHFHFRNPAEDGDGRSEMLMQAVVDEHEGVIAIGNSNPPITNLQEAVGYRKKILDLLSFSKNLGVWVAPLMTDHTSPAMMRLSRTSRDVVACWKAFFELVSNDGGMSISNIQRLHYTFRASYDDSIDAPPIPIHLHAERKFDRSGNRIAMLEREWYCVNTDIRELLQEHPEGIFVIKHVSDWRTEFIKEHWLKGYKIYGEIAAQYLYDCFDDLWEGPNNLGTSLNANKIRWPLPKGRESQLAIIEALLSGLECFLWGSDCAWHIDDPTQDRGVKITCDGVVCGGLAILPAVSVSIIVDICMKAGKPELINEVLSRRIRKLHGFGPAKTISTYERQDWQVPNMIKGSRKGEILRVRPFMRGETCTWKRTSVRLV